MGSCLGDGKLKLIPRKYVGDWLRHAPSTHNPCIRHSGRLSEHAGRDASTMGISVTRTLVHRESPAESHRPRLASDLLATEGAAIDAMRVASMISRPRQRNGQGNLFAFRLRVLLAITLVPRSPPAGFHWLLLQFGERVGESCGPQGLAVLLRKIGLPLGDFQFAPNGCQAK